jgi:hypothetical protein
LWDGKYWRMGENDHCNESMRAKSEQRNVERKVVSSLRRNVI